ncbi:MAG: DUF7507 domain-containing protein, partial [Methanosarcina sp.]
SNTVSVIDTATNTVVTTVGVGNYPVGVAVSPDETKVYVTNYFDNSISVIDATTNTVATIINTENNPEGIIVSPDGTKLYVINYGSNTVSVFDAATTNIIFTVNVGVNPVGVAFSPDGTKVYVTNEKNENVSVINTTTNSVVDSIVVGSYPYGVVVSPDGTKVYVTNYHSSTVSVINTTNNTIIATINGASAYEGGIDITPDGTRVYATNYYNNSIIVIDTATNEIIDTVPVGRGPVAFGRFIGPINPLVLEPGKNVTVTSNYTITQTDLDRGFVTNSAFANGTFNGNNITSNTDEETVTGVQNPALLTVKIASPTTYNSVGQNITYTYTVNNSGNVWISAPINITDNKTGTFTISNTGLATGQNVTGKANYTVTQADVDSGLVTNLAYATGVFNGTEVKSPNVTATVTADQNPQLNINKSASPENYSAVRQIITYTYNVTNSGNVNIVGPINITDNRTGILQINNSKYAYITNEAGNTISVIDIPTNTVVATIPVGTGPVGVAVSPDGTKVYVPNNGNDNVSVISTATNNVIASVPVGDFPLGVAFTPDGTKAYVANFNGGTVSIIDTATNTVTATLTGFSSPLGIAFTPDGTKAYIGNEGASTVSVIDTNTNSLITTITVQSNPYEITVNPSGTRAYVANLNSNTVSVINTTTDTVIDTISVGTGPYGVAVTPNGTRLYISNAFSDDVYVIDTATNSLITIIPAGDYPDGISITHDGKKVYVVNYLSENVSVIDIATNTVIDSVPVGDGPRAFGKFITPLILAPGENVTITFNYTITQDDLNNGSITNSAFANGTFNGNNVTSEPDNETVLAEQNPALLAVKIASPTNYSFVGQNITYTYNITNIGNVGISAPINITDNRTGEFTISNSALVPGQNVTGTANYTVTQADIDAGTITNLAYATGTFNNTEIRSTNVTATVKADQNPYLLMVKIAAPISYSVVGQNITYTYNVTNTGNVNITGPIVVADNKTGIIQIPVLILQPGQNITGTANYTITQADIDSGSVTNQAYANGTFNGNNITSNTDSETVIAQQNPALSINKSADPITYNFVGQVITYAYNVTNTGNVNIIGPINVTDNKTGTFQISNSKFAYITNIGSNNVSVIDIATDTVIATVNVGINPFGVAVNPDGTKVYVTNSNSNN